MKVNLEGTPEFQRGFDMVCPDVAGNDPSPYAGKQAEVPTHDTRVHETRVHNVGTEDQPLPNEPFPVSMVRYIMQSIIAETPYKPDMEDRIWWEAHMLEDQNALPYNVTADDIIQAYFRVFRGHEK